MHRVRIMITPDRFTCAGCGGLHTKPALGGAFIPPGTKANITYLLCSSCAKECVADQQKMLERIESRLLAALGAA
jgi:hypothetical protein